MLSNKDVPQLAGQDWSDASASAVLPRVRGHRTPTKIIHRHRLAVPVTILAERHADNPRLIRQWHTVSWAAGHSIALASHRSAGAALHAKILVVDQRLALIGSANFTGRGMESNLEWAFSSAVARSPVPSSTTSPNYGHAVSLSERQLLLVDVIARRHSRRPARPELLKRRRFPSAQINLGHRATGDAVDVGTGFLRGGLKPLPLRDHDSQQIPRAQVSRGGNREHPGRSCEHFRLLGGPGGDVLVPGDDRQARIGHCRDPQIVASCRVGDHARGQAPGRTMTDSVVTGKGDIRARADQHMSEPERVSVDVPPWLHRIQAASADHS